MFILSTQIVFSHILQVYTVCILLLQFWFDCCSQMPCLCRTITTLYTFDKPHFIHLHAAKWLFQTYQLTTLIAAVGRYSILKIYKYNISLNSQHTRPFRRGLFVTSQTKKARPIKHIGQLKQTKRFFCIARTSFVRLR